MPLARGWLITSSLPPRPSTAPARSIRRSSAPEASLHGRRASTDREDKPAQCCQGVSTDDRAARVEPPSWPGGPFVFQGVAISHVPLLQTARASSQATKHAALELHSSSTSATASRTPGVSRTATADVQQLWQSSTGSTSMQSVSTEQLRSKPLGSSDALPEQAATTLASTPVTNSDFRTDEATCRRAFDPTPSS